MREIARWPAGNRERTAQPASGSTQHTTVRGLDRDDDEVDEEEALSGGNNSFEVVRVGDTVRRARDSGSGFAARVLTYLETAQYPHAPRYLGLDGRGRDILSYVPGNTTDHPSQRADGAYARGGDMLGRLHEVTAGHPLAAGRECVIHGDPGPFNTIFREGLPTVRALVHKHRSVLLDALS